MAPRPGDKRLLAGSAKTTSARVILALVVAALVLTGCGSSSSDSSSSSTAATSPSGSSSGSESSPGTAPSDGDSGEAAGGGSPGTNASGGGQAAAGGAASGGGKHGPPIAPPKGAPEPTITPQERSEATVASILLESPSSQGTGGGPQALPAEFTCNGKNTSPALRWRGVPAGTAELALFTMNVQPVNEKLFFDWAVAGLSPELAEIEAGKLPKGAVVGRNSFGKNGYGICPEGGGETYMFVLFALPKKLSPSQGFDPLALRKAATDVSGNAGILALSYAGG
jgi:phosphatidylethanolamine-binding protein (PEBP) family uncharacterized protein